MVEPKQQVVHESEVQRQYVRIPIAARVEINGQDYKVKDLSSGGIGIVDIDTAYKKGETLRMTLILPFPEFSLDIHLETQVQSYSKKEKILGARFANLTPSQISLVNHIIRSYITGDVVAAGDILDVAQRSDFVRVRSQKTDDDQKPLSFTGSILPLLLIIMIGVLAFYVIARNVYDDFFVVSSSAGVVKSESLTFRAPVAGVYTQIIDESVFSVDRGTEIAGIILPATQTKSKLSYSLASPCDCFITKRHVYAGEYLAQGAPLFDMVPIDSSPYVELFLDAKNASKISINDQARLHIAGSDVVVGGQVTDIVFDEGAMTMAPYAGTPMIKFIVRPSEKLPIDFMGRPVSAEFTLF